MRKSEHFDAIKTMYEHGESIVDISRKLNMQRATVHTILRNNKFLKDYKTLTVAEIDDFLIKGMDPEELRKTYHLDSKKVARAVKRVGLKSPKSEPQQDTEEIDESMLEHSIDTRKIRHTQIGGKQYADITDYYNETGGMGW